MAQKLHTVKIFQYHGRLSAVRAFADRGEADLYLAFVNRDADLCDTYAEPGLIVYGWPEFKRYAENVLCPVLGGVEFEKTVRGSAYWRMGRRGVARFVHGVAK